MSYCTSPMEAAKMAVSAPTSATTNIALGAWAKMAEERATMYTPAVTMVAAWMSALTGVGPSIASGSHIYKGNCADLAVQARKRSKLIKVVEMTGMPPAVTWLKTPTLPLTHEK